ncbi:hypothetical protein BAUCODRAFT_473428 [Baudoinia panamericana UAMH 10762]|uniref:WW domain-containing protein n=1 Tax=Baudoinia panamericana (strain UAMH 10762) TaxID=717646 RepID=M2LPS6_BAUPA|nr:uncharacterized protein BAUCODRAFT_473428 [Baudoinia panamericana UAMH 10762]EMC96407.1 hypothetical protein BAUCODRAFT_473428 [Baudoinia panamericana UAMH 10762]
MADFAPPSGPPPPHVPAGWKAVWNESYKEWFYVNTYTKQSTWEKPTEPAHPPGDAPPPGAPPGYDHSSSRPPVPEKSGLQTNNPYHQPGQGGLTEDERLARKLQEEENARAGTANRGAADDFYHSGSSGAPSYGQGASPYGQQPASPSTAQLPPREEKKGLFSKLGSKFGGGGAQRPPQQQYGQSQYGPGYGGYPPQQYGGCVMIAVESYPSATALTVTLIRYQGGYPPQQVPGLVMNAHYTRANQPDSPTA